MCREAAVWAADRDTNVPIVPREDVVDLLQRWSRGSVTAQFVHEWAVARYAVSSYEPESTVVNEVLGALDMLDVNLTVPADIPAFLDALALPPDQAGEAAKLLERQWASIDVEQRRLLCQDDPLDPAA